MSAQINEPLPPKGTYYSPPPPLPSSPLWSQRESDDLDLAQVIQILRRRGLVISGVAIAVASVLWAWTLTRTPIYRGEFRVLIESVDEANPSQELLRSEQGNFRSTVDYDTQIEVLLSPQLLQPISRELQEEYPELTVEELAAGLSINRLRETKVLQVSYRGLNPQKIQDILDEVAQHYLDYSFKQRQASLDQGIQFVDEQLPDLRERVNNLQVRLERFRQQYSLLDPENRGEDLSELISRVEEQRQQLQTELSQARSLYRSLQGQLSVSPEEALAAASLSESSRYQALLNQIQELEAEIAVESAKYQPDSPQLAILRERRDNLVPMLEAEAANILGDRLVAPTNRIDGNLTPTSIELSRQLIDAANDVQMLQARSQTLAQVEQDLKQEFALVPGLARQYTDLQRELSIATESLNRFLTTRETLQIDAAQKSIPWQLIAEPKTSRIPISPNIPRNLMLGILSGLVLGGIAALLVEKLDQVYHSPDELKSSTGLPLLGIIPFHPGLQDQPTNVRAKGSATFQQNGTVLDRTTVLQPSAHHRTKQSSSQSATRRRRTTFQSSMFFEAFRSLYTNIRFLGSDAPIRSLVISSAIPSEGKSTIALYLARAAAVMGQRVLLVDADLRSPKHHIRLGLTNIRGLSNLVSESLPIHQVVQRSPLDENLAVVTAGPIPPDPVKLLSSRRMQSLIEQFQADFDFVVYDMPPILGFADSNLVAAYTDGMIMVAGLGKTERSVIDRAIDEVRLSPVSVLGVVANGIKAYTTQVYGYHRYYRYYPTHEPEHGQEHNGAKAMPSDRVVASSTSRASSQPEQSEVRSPSTYIPYGDDGGASGSGISESGISESGISNADHLAAQGTHHAADHASPAYTLFNAEDVFPDEVPSNEACSDDVFPRHTFLDESLNEFPDESSNQSPDEFPDESSNQFPDKFLNESSDKFLDDRPDQSPEPFPAETPASPFRTQGWQFEHSDHSVNRYDDNVSEAQPGVEGVPSLTTAPSVTAVQPASAVSRRQAHGVATVNGDSPFNRLSIIHKILIGVGLMVSFGAIAWILYVRTTPLPPSSPDSPPADSSTDNAPSMEPISSPLDAAAPEMLQNPPDQERSASASETSPEPPTSDLQESVLTDGENSSVSPEPTSLDPELSPEMQDPFAEAVRLAQEAVDAGESANTPEEWSRIAEQWQRAAALMTIVAPTDERFTIARDRTVLYRNNGEFARQKVLELLRNKDFNNVSGTSP